jgi:hypothetical protein
MENRRQGSFTAMIIPSWFSTAISAFTESRIARLSASLFRREAMVRASPSARARTGPSRFN